eukprot:scaffold449_cov241-Pinguiococcus_pyrenoidosus.AAC.26
MSNRRRSRRLSPSPARLSGAPFSGSAYPPATPIGLGTLLDTRCRIGMKNMRLKRRILPEPAEESFVDGVLRGAGVSADLADVQ